MLDKFRKDKGGARPSPFSLARPTPSQSHPPAQAKPHDGAPSTVQSSKETKIHDVAAVGGELEMPVAAAAHESNGTGGIAPAAEKEQKAVPSIPKVGEISERVIEDGDDEAAGPASVLGSIAEAPEEALPLQQLGAERSEGEQGQGAEARQSSERTLERPLQNEGTHATPDAVPEPLDRVDAPAGVCAHSTRLPHTSRSAAISISDLSHPRGPRPLTLAPPRPAPDAQPYVADGIVFTSYGSHTQRSSRTNYSIRR